MVIYSRIRLSLGIPEYIWNYLAYIAETYGKKLVVKKNGEVIMVDN